MADLVNQQTETQTAQIVFEKTTKTADVVTAMITSPAATLLDAKLLKRPKRIAPYTYRRPGYLDYIEYA